MRVIDANAIDARQNYKYLDNIIFNVEMEDIEIDQDNMMIRVSLIETIARAPVIIRIFSIEKLETGFSGN